MTRYNASNIHELAVEIDAARAGSDDPRLFGALPRRTVYGSAAAVAAGFSPIHETATTLLDPKDWKEAIRDAHERQIFPMYYDLESGSLAKWYQNGLNYCWAWSLVAAVEMRRQAERKPAVKLAPTGLGADVNYRNQGNYLDSAIQFAAENGVPELSYLPDIFSRSPSRWKTGWKENAVQYRPTAWIDTDNSTKSTMVRHCVSALCAGLPGYAAWNRLRHAMCCVGLVWDETVKGNLVWVIRNSHGEVGHIEIEGAEYGCPDEFYGITATAN